MKLFQWVRKRRKNLWNLCEEKLVWTKAIWILLVMTSEMHLSVGFRVFERTLNTFKTAIRQFKNLIWLPECSLVSLTAFSKEPSLNPWPILQKTSKGFKMFKTESYGLPKNWSGNIFELFIGSRGVADFRVNIWDFIPFTFVQFHRPIREQDWILARSVTK